MTAFEVIVETKPEVLDPEGRAIESTLKNLDNQKLESVRVSKRFVLRMSDEDKALVEQIARKHLCNPVCETFVVRRLP